MFSHRFFFVKNRMTESAASFFVRLLTSTVPVPSPSAYQRYQRRHFVTVPCHWQKKPKTDHQRIMAPITTTTGEEAIGSRQKMEVDQEQRSKLLFVKLTEHASAPSKGSKYAAGYDLKSAYDAVVPKRGSALVKTDIQIQLPSGTYGRVAPRSGLALKNKIDVGAGVIDEDYRGNVGVILFNHADEDFPISKGDRIAQLICEKILYPEAVEVENLDTTERGAGGFGSTGVKKAKLELDQEKATVAGVGQIQVSPAKKATGDDDKVLSPTKQQPTVPAE